MLSVNSNHECVFYRESNMLKPGEWCTALMTLDCAGCKFYKSKKEYEMDSKGYVAKINKK